MGVADTGTLHHICFVVKDLENTAESLATALSLEWHFFTIEPVSSTVHGQEVPFSFKGALAQVGGTRYELISPLSGESVYVEHLKAKGDGFHHTCFTYPSLEAARAARDELLSQGRELVQSADMGDIGEFYYFHIAETDALLEVLYLD